MPRRNASVSARPMSGWISRTASTRDRASASTPYSSPASGVRPRSAAAASAASSNAWTLSWMVGIRCASAGVLTIRRSVPVSAASRALSRSSARAPSVVRGNTPMYV